MRRFTEQELEEIYYALSLKRAALYAKQQAVRPTMTRASRAQRERRNAELHQRIIKISLIMLKIQEEMEL